MLSRRQVWGLIGRDLVVLVLTAVSFAIASRNRSDAVFLSLVASLPPELPLLVDMALTLGLHLVAALGG